MSDGIDALDFQPEADWEALSGFFPAAIAALPLHVQEALRASPGLDMMPAPDGWLSVNHREIGWLFDVSAASLFTAANGCATFKMLRADGVLDELVVESF